ncbi:equilibrative nucleobase transporter 1-like [Mercenaria mercenaria]|uniref:equilibrative nucleobase transporter 1-like n=1 Tax=Mercenaria mercenaria TaxID=6596 RepID=UPI00234E7880|nr:equilibrative nucleobase transporter 1-like [Mercenaria mercenaria]
MELYRKYPVLITIWALMENLLFAGVIFGWGSLVFILKEEGFYFDYCTQSDFFNQNNSTLLETTSAVNVSNSLSDRDTVLSNISKADEVTSKDCPAQESKLNLWYSIATSAMNLTYAAIAYLQKRFGTRITRAVFVSVYLIGTLCMAFATPELPWLLLPGLLGIGIGGMTVSCTNIQVSFLHPRLRSTIVALFIGLFDFSSINKQLIRIAYENGIPRRTSYIFMSVVFAVITSISTMLFLPKMFIGDVYLEEMERSQKLSKCNDDKKVEQAENQDELPKSQEQELVENSSSVDLEVSPESSKLSFCSTVFSITCMLHIYWTFVHAIRMFTFIGQINVWLENVFDYDETKVGDMLSSFSYITMAAIGTALFCGFVYDYQRKRYAGSGEIKRVYLPVVLPMGLVFFYSTGTTVFCLIKNDVTPYFAFVLFTFFRTSLYAVAFAFLENAFSADYFGNLMGILLFVTGLGGLIQYPLFKWYEAYDGSYLHVNIFLLVLQVSTVMHLVLLYIKGCRDKGTVHINVCSHEMKSNNALQAT